MTKKLLLGLLCSSFVFTACTQKSSMQTQPAGDLSEKRPAMTTVTLNEQNGSGQSGTAVFEDLGGQTRVSIKLDGSTEYGDPQPAHIHMGACPTPGAVKYPLTEVSAGISETTIDAAYGTLWGGDMAINVHKSAAESSVYTACGDLTVGTPDSMGDVVTEEAPQY